MQNTQGATDLPAKDASAKLNDAIHGSAAGATQAANMNSSSMPGSGSSGDSKTISNNYGQDTNRALYDQKKPLSNIERNGLGNTSTSGMGTDAPMGNIDQRDGIATTHTSHQHGMGSAIGRANVPSTSMGSGTPVKPTAEHGTTTGDVGNSEMHSDLKTGMNAGAGIHATQYRAEDDTGAPATTIATNNETGSADTKAGASGAGTSEQDEERLQAADTKAGTNLRGQDDENPRPSAHNETPQSPAAPDQTQKATTTDNGTQVGPNLRPGEKVAETETLGTGPLSNPGAAQTTGAGRCNKIGTGIGKTPEEMGAQNGNGATGKAKSSAKKNGKSREQETQPDKPSLMDKLLSKLKIKSLRGENSKEADLNTAKN